MTTRDRKAEQLREVISKLTRIMAQKDIKVTQRGTRAFCAYDSRTGVVKSINLPVIPPNPSDKFVAALHGYLDHEVGHALYTVPGEAKEVAEEATLKIEDKQRHQIVNVVEDVRIENVYAKDFPGSLPNLEATRNFVADEIWGPSLDELGDLTHPMNRAKAVGIAFVPWLRAMGGHKACRQFIEERGLAELYEPLLAKIPDLAERLMAMKSTKDAAKLADDLINILGADKRSSGSGSDDEEGDSSKSKKADKRSKKEAEETEEREEAEEDDTEGADEDGEEDGDDHDHDHEDDGDAEEDDDLEEDGDDIGEGEECADGEDGDDGDPADATDGEADDEAGEGTDQASGGKEGGEAEEEPSDFEIDLDAVKDMDEELSDALERELGDAFGRDEQVDFTRDNDRIEPFPANPRVTIEGVEREVGKITGVMGKALERLIVARQQSYFVGGYRSGRINGPALHRIMQGDDRAFRRKVTHETKDVAISLLVDNSGSMQWDNKIGVAMKAAWAFSEVLTRLKINHEVIGFTTCARPRDPKFHEEVQRMYRETKLPSRHIRTKPVYMPLYKAFGENFGVEQKKRMATAMTNLSFLQGNNDALGVEYAATRLAQQKEARKILIVFSDGAPSDAWTDDTGVQESLIGRTLKKVIRKIEAGGIETIGIGIQDKSVTEFYTKHMVLMKLADLPALVMGQLKTILLGGNK